MKKPQELYYIRALDEKRCAVTKEIGGDIAQTYVIENSNCECPGAIYHKVQCKHLKIKNRWEQLERKPHTFEFQGKSGILVATPLKDINDGEEHG